MFSCKYISLFSSWTFPIISVVYACISKDKIILDHVSYEFRKSVMYAILGSSGSGKTTLLSLLAGLDVSVEGVGA